MVYLFINFLIILLDQTSKNIIKTKFYVEEKREIVKNKLYIWHKKTGVSFSIFSGHVEKISFVTAFFILMGYILFISAFVSHKNREIKAGLSMFLGGAVGNFIDRVRDKEVTDFLFFNFKRAPIFNLADICLLFGTIVSIFGMIKCKK